MNSGSDVAGELLERFRTWLRDRHLPVTRQRDLVALVVFSAGEHLSVEEMQRSLNSDGHRIGTATIYRSLDVLVQSGLVRVHDFGEGFKRYEAIHSATQHGHLICTRCGKVAEFSTERFERVLPMVADEYEFQHVRHRIEIYGLCTSCQHADFGALARVGR